MPRFFIEVPHQPNKAACIQAVQSFLSSGSHFLTHADWGCMDGDHKAWIIVEVENKEQAQSIVPAMYRSDTKVVRLNQFTMEQMNNILQHHPDLKSV